jgi:hypothetical protein
MINAYKDLVGKLEGNRTCGRPRHRWEDNIRNDLREIGWEVSLMLMTQDKYQWQALVNMLMKFLVP